MPSSEEDGRKKRTVHPIEEETPKKVRVDAGAAANTQKSPPNHSTSTTLPSTQKPPPLPTQANRKAPPPINTSNVASKPNRSPVTDNSPSQSNQPPSFSLQKIRNRWKDTNRRVWDLEGALQYLVQDPDEKEYLTHDESHWVTFRVGHAGDASKIASWYQLAKEQVLEQEAQEQQEEALEEEEEDPEIDTDSMLQHIPTAPAAMDPPEEGDEGENSANSANMLEVWLADGFGDDRRLPFLYSLVANVHYILEPVSTSESNTEDGKASEKEENGEEATSGEDSEANEGAEILPDDMKRTAMAKKFGAVALLTIGYDDALEKTLRIEWLGLNPALPAEVLSVLRERLWLRLSTLSVMTACQGGIEWEHRFSLDPLKRQRDQEQKQNHQQNEEVVKESLDQKPAARVSPRTE